MSARSNVNQDEKERSSTGARGPDTNLGGGLIRNGIDVVTGHPGAGKTILSNQLACVQWFRPAEVHIDALVDLLLTTVREQRIQRLFIDGFAGFRSTHPSERISSVFSSVSDELVTLGVTTLISDETPELYILVLRRVELKAELARRISVLKARDSGADRRLWRYGINGRGFDLVAPFAAGDHPVFGGGA